MDIGREFRDVVEDVGRSGGFHALADGVFAFGEFRGRTGAVFGFRESHFVAAGDDADAADSRIKTFPDVGDCVADFDDLLDGKDVQVLHVSENHVRGGAA